VTPTDAAAVLRRGGIVAFPTETVYGLGADATNAEALGRVFAVKGRPTDHPLICHLASGDDLKRWADAVPPEAERLAARFWPGPLSMILPRHRDISPAATGGRATVGLRVPDHPMAIEMIAALGRPVAAPSANRFGKVSPTTVDHVRADLDGDIDGVVDGGPSRVGVESTIVDLTGPEPLMLRPGAVTMRDLAEALGRAVVDGTGGPSRAPGMMQSHYAPTCQVHLAENLGDADRLASRLSGRVEVLAPDASEAVWAHSLYTWLREADQRRLDHLVVVRPSTVGVGAAVVDRLRKAASTDR
jgi:L-threonylcarbamoyladenylate synthase